jgi:hypothetical protein
MVGLFNVLTLGLHICLSAMYGCIADPDKWKLHERTNDHNTTAQQAQNKSGFPAQDPARAGTT